MLYLGIIRNRKKIKVMTVKEIKTTIENMNDGDKLNFTFNDKSLYINCTKFESGNRIYSVNKVDPFSFDGMNINKIGPTCLTLYAYDMLGTKTTGKIRYDQMENIELVIKETK